MLAPSFATSTRRPQGLRAPTPLAALLGVLWLVACDDAGTAVPDVVDPDPDGGSSHLDGGTDADAGEAADCLEIDMQPAAPYPSAAVRTSFVLRHCDGRPFAEPLDPASISVINDETAMPFNASLEGGGAVAPRLDELSMEPATAPTLGLYAVLTLDLSNSIVRSGALAEVLDAAQAFVDAVVRDVPAQYRYQVAVWAFGSRGQTQLVQDFTTDHTALSASIDALRATEGLGTTDLYGAYTSSLSHLRQKSGTADIVDQQLVIVTDGRHEAGDFDNQRTAALAARDQSHARGIEVFSVAVASPADDEPFLRELATSTSHFDAVETLDQVRDAFVRASQNLIDLPKATYVVGVCTPVELGDASLTIAVDYRGVHASASARYGTDSLDGDVSSCDPLEVVNPCLRISCGEARLRGFFCGDCGYGSCVNQHGEALAEGARWSLDDAVACRCAEDLTLCTDRCETLREGTACGSCDNTCPAACDGQASCVHATQVSLADGSCAVMSDGTARCWGALHIFDPVTPQTPSAGVEKTVPQLAGAVQIKLRPASGFHSGCALMGSGVLKCFGVNAGNGEFSSDLPVEVEGLSGVRDFTLGVGHTCALLSDGTVQCWGDPRFLGPDPSTCIEYFQGSVRPVPVGGLTDVVQLAGTCALIADGTVRCWGPSTQFVDCAPPVVDGVDDVRNLAAGSSHVCALKNDNTLLCWGSNYYGELGIDQPLSNYGFGRPTLENVIHVAAYEGWTCAVTAAKETYCWGLANLGNGSAPRSTVLPTQVAGVTNAAGVTVGATHACILTEDGNLVCWGDAEAAGRAGSGFLSVGPVDW